MDEQGDSGKAAWQQAAYPLRVRQHELVGFPGYIALLYKLWIDYFAILNTQKYFINIFNNLKNINFKNSTTCKGALYTRSKYTISNFKTLPLLFAQIFLNNFLKKSPFHWLSDVNITSCQCTLDSIKR